MIKMEMDQGDLRNLINSIDRLKEAYANESRNMNRNCSKEYKMFLIQNIVTEKYANTYPELNEVYVQWKQDHGAKQGFWKLWGSLVSSLSVREIGNGFSVGIERNAMPSQTSSMGKQKKITPVWMYAYYGEHGHWQRGMFTGYQPARPIFRPSQDEYVATFMGIRRKETINKIRSVW